MKRRDHIRARTEIAALLCQLREPTCPHCGTAVPTLIPYPHAKKMHEDQVIKLFSRDHFPIRVIDGGPDAHWNIVHRFRPEHDVKTATVDVPQIRKGDRIRRVTEEASRRLLAKHAGEPMPEPARQSRWPKRKPQSRSSFGRRP